MTGSVNLDAGQASLPSDPASVELRHVSRRFGHEHGTAGRMAQRAGLIKAPVIVHAVDDVSLTIFKGEVVGLVGESGCGKSTLGRIGAGLLPPSSGQVLWKGRDIKDLSSSDFRDAKLKMQMVFQNPFASLNPRLPISEIVGEAPRIHGLIAGEEAEFVDEQLRRVGLNPVLKGRYAHQFSGGERQRVGIARALAVGPEVLVCDEPVASLDVSIQAQVLNLFMDLRDSLGLTSLFISHDLGVVEHMSDRVAIMYLGRIVEEAPASELFSCPNHPYTQALLEEMPRIDSSRRAFSELKGELPSAIKPPSGCHFHPRCPFAMRRCRSERPALKTIAPGHKSACHLNEPA
jgi:peptide/nickel transport system ATP-binding protein